MSLKRKVLERTMKAMGMTEQEVLAIAHEDESVLHDPFLYDGMDELVTKLYAFKLEQEKNPKHILVVDTDYDTDGIMSAAVISAALDVFNINYRVYVPTMAQGYGLNPTAVDDMKALFETNGNVIKMILTADNGTNAIAGVDKANEYGIRVLVTDHHLGGSEYAKAEVIVNPNKLMPDFSPEPYPFKGNAGGAVAWKTMMAYASKYAEDKLPLIFDLIVFAGIANVADVMPIIDENHYMVRKSVEEIKRLIKIRQVYGHSDLAYHDVKLTQYPHYNAVFYGLYDIIMLVQETKDKKRQEQGKKPIPLPDDEEFISWYFSPMMNAPRRIHATSREAMLSMLETRIYIRHDNIKEMIRMNDEKSKLRNEVLEAINYDQLYKNYGNVLFVNSQHGISGLIAGQVAEKTGRATIVFAIHTELPNKVYSYNEFDSRFDSDELIIGASARSNDSQPLNVIVERIAHLHPDVVVGGGGHAAAAGYSIRYKYLNLFASEFNRIAKEVQDEIAELTKKRVAAGDVILVPENIVKLTTHDYQDSGAYGVYNISNSLNLPVEMMEVLEFQNQLKPFGKDFNAQTKFIMDLNPMELMEPKYNLNLGFWKTFKFNLNGVDVITFDIELATVLKDRIAGNNDSLIPVTAELKINEFNGRISPQLILCKGY